VQTGQQVLTTELGVFSNKVTAVPRSAAPAASIPQTAADTTTFSFPAPLDDDFRLVLCCRVEHAGHAVPATSFLRIPVRRYQADDVATRSSMAF
jgi:hypothetical protein